MCDRNLVIWENFWQLVSLANFSLFRKDRVTRGGGIAVYVKSSIQCKILDILKPSDMLTEAMWIQLRPTVVSR